LPSYSKTQGSNLSFVGNYSFEIYKHGFKSSTTEVNWHVYFERSVVGSACYVGLPSNPSVLKMTLATD